MIRIFKCQYENSDFVEYLSTQVEEHENDLETALQNGYNEEDGYGKCDIPQINVLWQDIQKHFQETYEIEIHQLKSICFGNILDNGNVKNAESLIKTLDLLLHQLHLDSQYAVFEVCDQTKQKIQRFLHINGEYEFAKLKL